MEIFHDKIDNYINKKIEDLPNTSKTIIYKDFYF